MAKRYISNKDESARMFKNNFLEMFSRVHHTVPLFLYVPVILYFYYKTIFVSRLNMEVILLLTLGGLAVWTIVEYIIHRFIFHYHPDTEWGKKVHFMFHGVHHDYPNDSKRLVMVPTISVPLAVFFYYIFKVILGADWLNPFFAAFLAGYVFYDTSHYALHHFNFKSKFWLRLKHHHMIHHYKDPDNGFGVSFTFWDHVFRTTFKREK